MGREVTAIQAEDKKPNGVTIALDDSPNDNVHNSSKIAAAKVQAKDHEVRECTEMNLFDEKCHETKDVLSAKTTNRNTDSSEEENEKHEVQKTGDNKELSSPAAEKELTSHFVVTQPSDLVTEKHESYTVDTEAVVAGLNLSPNANNIHSPCSSKNSQVIDGLN